MIPNLQRIKCYAFASFIALLRPLHSYQSEILLMYPFLPLNNHFFAPEIPTPLIFVQNRSHQGVNTSDLLSDFKRISYNWILQNNITN